MTPDDISIEPATDDELEWAARLMASSEPWITLRRNIDATRPFFRAADSQVYIAHTEGKPCGFLVVRPRGVINSPYIASLAVADGYRSRGIGSHLMHFAEEKFRADAKHLFICVSSFNTRARQLYERLGYTAVATLQDQIIDGAAEILLRKRLR